MKVGNGLQNRRKNGKNSYSRRLFLDFYNRPKGASMIKKPVKKQFLKTWCIGNFYNYQIFEVDAGGEKWLEATPITKGVTRTAENEKVLKIILENDAINMNKFWEKVR